MKKTIANPDHCRSNPRFGVAESWENSTVEKSVESLDLRATMMVSRRLSLDHKNGDVLHHPKHLNADKHISKPNLSKHAVEKHP
jgi:hypothetical protein